MRPSIIGFTSSSGMNSPYSGSEASSRSSSPKPGSRGIDASVIDIGGSRIGNTMKAELERKFLWKASPCHSHRVIPASVLHDETGLQMWHELNRMPDYYQTRDEIELLQQNSAELAQDLRETFTLVDLGCGDVRKVMPLLDTLEELQIPIRYYALDLSHSVLVKCMSQLLPRYHNVQCFGLWGTFDDCLEWAKDSDNQSPKCYMSLGSMFGNDHFEPAVARLKEWTDIMRPQDRMLLGLDATQDRNEIWKSYHDEHELFHDFIQNGMLHSNAILGHEWYKPSDWKISGEFQDLPLMHHFVIRAMRDNSCEALGLNFNEGDKIVCYEGFKYEKDMMDKQFAAAGLDGMKFWRSPSGRICQYLLRPTTTS